MVHMSHFKRAIRSFPFEMIDRKYSNIVSVRCIFASKFLEIIFQVSRDYSRIASIAILVYEIKYLKVLRFVPTSTFLFSLHVCQTLVYIIIKKQVDHLPQAIDKKNGKLYLSNVGNIQKSFHAENWFFDTTKLNKQVYFHHYTVS